ncbi:unnamed protein product, partial [marine sediment metagenome]
YYLSLAYPRVFMCIITLSIIGEQILPSRIAKVTPSTNPENVLISTVKIPIIKP